MFAIISICILRLSFRMLWSEKDIRVVYEKEKKDAKRRQYRNIYAIQVWGGYNDSYNYVAQQGPIIDKWHRTIS